MSNKLFVQFGAEWCAPCKMMRPLAADVAEKLGVEFSYVDIEAEGNDDFVNDISGIQSIPTFILYVDGVETNRAVGRMSQATLEEFLS